MMQLNELESKLVKEIEEFGEIFWLNRLISAHQEKDIVAHWTCTMTQHETGQTFQFYVTYSEKNEQFGYHDYTFTHEFGHILAMPSRRIVDNTR